VTYTATHWGVYRPRVAGGRLVGMDGAEWDADPSPIGQSMVDGITAPCRVRRPAIREGFLRARGASRERRGQEAFVEVPWDEALDLVADELRRVIDRFGNSAIFGGSYGWASAGRFHHAQGQLRRFLNTLGGFTFHTDTYSLGAGRVLLPHILGPMDDFQVGHTAWTNLERHCRLFVAFGGLPIKNTQVTSGGAQDHVARGALARMAAAGVAFVNVSPVRHDLDAVPGAEWLALRPGTDTALMLGLAHVLLDEGLCDEGFLSRYTTGFAGLREHILGHDDATPKTPRWAAEITGLEAGVITTLARRMAGTRSMLNVAWALQRAMGGEQPFWMGVSLAAMLGQIGLPGGGFGLGYGCMNMIGGGNRTFSGPRLPQGKNPVESFIPVARIADMLLHPGERFDYNGSTHAYPDIRLVYWAGGNAFHHHQDLNRLVRAWKSPETIVVHEQFWTAQAKFADIVLPATTALERDDIGSAAGERFLIAMRGAVAPVAEARDDHTIFAGLAARLGTEAAFTEGRDTRQWLAHLYEASRPRAEAAGIELPSFPAFWEAGRLEFPAAAQETVMLEAFRADPDAARLSTPSGKIEIGAGRIAGFGYADCPGHPVWRAPAEYLGAPEAQRYPLHLLSNQPRTRLHGQYDHGRVSRAAKVAGREPLTMNPADAAARGIAAGDVIRVFNARGAFLAGAVLSDGIRPGVVQIATGAWYDPAEPGVAGSLDKHGNPNVVTPDVGASSLSQGCSAQSTLVEIARFEGVPPAVTAFDPPAFVPPASGQRSVA
jgi:biotin/methionine sulfoxide reductase